MRFYTVLAVRPQYYDRTPANKTIGYTAAGVAPHGGTQRASYTVPTARKALIGAGISVLVVDSGGAVIGPANAYATITPSGGSAQVVNFAELYSITVGALDRSINGGGVTMLAGDNTVINTSDGNTGGTHTFETATEITEFDA